MYSRAGTPLVVGPATTPERHPAGVTGVFPLVTIGVYGYDGASFLRALRDADVGLLLDVRQRRGVRGAEYAWANAQRLQAALGRAWVDYEHRRDLAPTTELRQLQYAADEVAGVGKRSREVLDVEYVRRYTSEVLDGVDLGPVAAALEAGPVALLCVEADPAACHRSLVARRMAERFAVRVTHLCP